VLLDIAQLLRQVVDMLPSSELLPCNRLKAATCSMCRSPAAPPSLLPQREAQGAAARSGQADSQLRDLEQQIEEERRRIAGLQVRGCCSAAFYSCLHCFFGDW